MQTEATGQLPKALDGIELRAIRWEEIEPETRGAFVSPRLVERCVMVSDIVDNERNAPATFGRDGPPLLQEGLESHGIETVGFTFENELAVTQANRPEVSHAPPTGVVEQYRLTILGRDPHPATRSILLEMDLICRPEIDVSVGDQLSEFFYIPAEVPGLRERSSAAVYAFGSPTCGKSSGTAGPPTGCGIDRE